MAQISRGRRLMGEINVVPYIDVMLVLLIIFMITTPLLTQGVKVDLPHVSARSLPTGKVTPVVLSVNRQGEMYLTVGGSTEGPVGAQTIHAHITAALAADPNRAVMIKADTAVPYGTVMRAMVILQDAGVHKMDFISQPKGARSGS
jgi:biopolymer transport protein TolR